MLPRCFQRTSNAKPSRASEAIASATGAVPTSSTGRDGWSAIATADSWAEAGTDYTAVSATIMSPSWWSGPTCTVMRTTRAKPPLCSTASFNAMKLSPSAPSASWGMAAHTITSARFAR